MVVATNPGMKNMRKSNWIISPQNRGTLPKTNGWIPKMMGLGKPVTGPCKNDHFWYQFVRFLVFFHKKNFETTHGHDLIMKVNSPHPQNVSQKSVPKVMKLPDFKQGGFFRFV